MSGYLELHIVSCDFHEGVLTLRGHVSSFHLKQVAQTLIRDLEGVGEINNRLEVASDLSTGGEER
jgi:osmotically-inducible protein OsmY